MINFKLFIAEKKQEQKVFYNCHGGHAQPTKKKVEESVNPPGNIFYELLEHPVNKRNAKTVDTHRPETARAFRDFSTPYGEPTDTAHEADQGLDDQDWDYMMHNHLTSGGVNNALTERATGKNIPHMKDMTRRQHQEALRAAHLISDEIFRSAPLHRTATVYHGTKLNPLEHLDSNGRMHVPGFLSTSADIKQARNFAIDGQLEEKRTGKGGGHILHIELPQGMKVIPMGDEYSHHSEEEEVLLPHGTVFEHVSSRGKDEDGFYIHHFRVHTYR